MDELKPCPFCGSVQLEMQHTEHQLSGDEYFLWCDGCDMRGSIHESPEKARTTWNTRTPPASGDGKGVVIDQSREPDMHPTPAAVGVTVDDEMVNAAWKHIFMHDFREIDEMKFNERLQTRRQIVKEALEKALSARSPAWDTDAARDVVAERQRQISAEGWTPGHDDEHGDGSMADAAACYALTAPVLGKRYWIEGDNISGGEMVPSQWPRSWRHEWWKPKDRRRDLVRAGALILAEIERLDREKLRLGG